MKTKKFFSIILAGILLTTSNISLFSQNIQVFSDNPYLFTSDGGSQVYVFENEIEEIEKMFSDLEKEIKLVVFNRRDGMTKRTQKRLFKHVTQIKEKYSDLLTRMKLQSTNLERVTRTVNPYFDGLLNKISREAYPFIPFGASWKRIESGISAAPHLMGRGIPDISEEILIDVKDMHKFVKADLNIHLKVFSGERKSLFSALEMVTSNMSKEELYRMVYTTLSDADREGINVLVEAGEKAPSLRKLAKSIRTHLKTINRAKSALSRSKLIYVLKEYYSKDVDSRIKYVSEVTRLDLLEQKVGKEIVKTERGLSGILRSATPLIVVGVVLTAATIVEVNAQNVFPKGSNHARRMASIKKAIENDQDISVSDALDFYVGHFEENQSVIENSNAHYINMLYLLAATQKADNDKDMIFDIINKEDPSIQVSHILTSQEVNNAFDIYMENNPAEAFLSQELI